MCLTSLYCVSTSSVNSVNIFMQPVPNKCFTIKALLRELLTWNRIKEVLSTKCTDFNQPIKVMLYTKMCWGNMVCICKVCGLFTVKQLHFCSCFKILLPRSLFLFGLIIILFIWFQAKPPLDLCPLPSSAILPLLLLNLEAITLLVCSSE